MLNVKNPVQSIFGVVHERVVPTTPPWPGETRNRSTAWSESFGMHSMLGFPTSLFSSQRCSPRAFFFCGPRAAERVKTRPRRPWVNLTLSLSPSPPCLSPRGDISYSIFSPNKFFLRWSLFHHFVAIHASQWVQLLGRQRRILSPLAPLSESAPSPRKHQKKKKSVSPHDSQFIQANVRQPFKVPLDSAFHRLKMNSSRPSARYSGSHLF